MKGRSENHWYRRTACHLARDRLCFRSGYPWLSPLSNVIYAIQLNVAWLSVCIDALFRYLLSHASLPCFDHVLAPNDFRACLKNTVPLSISSGMINSDFRLTSHFSFSCSHQSLIDPACGCSGVALARGIGVWRLRHSNERAK